MRITVRPKVDLHGTRRVDYCRATGLVFPIIELSRIYGSSVTR